MDEQVIPCFIKALVRIAGIGPEFSPDEAEGEVAFPFLVREIELVGLVTIADRIRLVAEGRLLLNREQARVTWNREDGSPFFSVFPDPARRYLPAMREVIAILQEEHLVVR